MTPILGTRRTVTLTVIAFVVTLFAPLLTTSTTPTAGAATPLTVAQAIAGQSGGSGTVRGYVVGQPTATNTVVTSSYPNDYALALADSATETSTSKMVYVQITASFRSTYGLATHPSLQGQQLDVTGTLSAYFSHPGLTSTTAFAKAGGTTPPPTGDGPYDSTYYANALGKTGTALRSSLHTIIKTQTTLTYDQVWDALKDTDQDPNNSSNVIEIYSGRSISKSLNGGGVDDWNREHVWAKSHGDFGTATGPGTDVHHLRPEDVTVNSTRSNKDFDNGGAAVSQCSDCWSDADSFEPRDAVKGDVARMILYMAIRYEGDDGWPDLEPNQSTANGTAPYIGKLSVLLAWNAADPPDAFEMRRNDRIYTQWQHNRNPFIDHPEWATAIFA
jgi:endonuclease I